MEKIVKSVQGFTYTTAIKKLRKLNKRIKVIPGGTSAGKTYGILPILIDKAIKNDRLEISVVSESVPHLRRGALKDFIKIMQSTNRWIEGSFNKSLLKYTFQNGSFIEFFSVDQPDKLRGARRNILYVNECNNVDFEAYQQLSIRTSHEVWLDYNPTHEFWVHTQVIPDKDAQTITLTYKDNEALSPSIVNEIEKAREKAKTSSYWANWFKVYGLGEIGSLQGVVFDNWTQKELPEDARLIGTGVDFGYTNDPTAIVDLYKWNDTYIFDERYYETKLSNEVIASRVKNTPVVVCDSAEPKSIARLQELGANATGSIKGKDSIRFGIELLQKQPFYITPRSVNLIREIRGYVWETDRDNNYLQTAKGVDHAIDAMRYVHTYCTYYTGNYVIG